MADRFGRTGRPQRRLRAACSFRGRDAARLRKSPLLCLFRATTLAGTVVNFFEVTMTNTQTQAMKATTSPAAAYSKSRELLDLVYSHGFGQAKTAYALDALLVDIGNEFPDATRGEGRTGFLDGRRSACCGLESGIGGRRERLLQPRARCSCRSLKRTLSITQ
jgi:hypothetical protein